MAHETVEPETLGWAVSEMGVDVLIAWPGARRGQAVARMMRPAMDQRQRHLRVELHPERLLANLDRLILESRATR